jgi:phosphohistidine phosphatase
MKRLTLVRHAKSSREDPLLEDIDRPLSKRGEENAPLMGKRLAKKEMMPDLLLTSPAKRAVKTARIIAGKIGFAKDKVEKVDAIYEASPETLLGILRGLTDDCQHVMMVGHNPGFTDLNNVVNRTKIDNIPTCGVVCIDLDIAAWSELTAGQGTQVFFDYPKNPQK